MPSTTVTLAYAIEVDIVKLGSSLDALDQVQAVIDTLRMCNRFGRGEKVAITKLPIELVPEVEGYIIGEERQWKLEEWESDFRCWEGRCEPLDHLDSYSIGEVYCEMLGEGISYIEDDCEADTGRIQEIVEDVLADLHSEGDDRVWFNKHEHRKLEWFVKVGMPTEKTRGRFTKFNVMLRKQFGLTAWIGHRDGPKAGIYMNNTATGSTSAYLYLPNSWSTEHAWDHDYKNPDGVPRRIMTESSHACEPHVPEKPSDKLLDRFNIAVQALDCGRLTYKPRNAEAKGKKSDEATSVESEEERTSVVATTIAIEPKLMMLLVDRDDTKDEW